MTVTKDPTLDLVSTAYSVAVNPSRFEDLLTSWDIWLEACIAGEDATFGSVVSAFHAAIETSEQLDQAQDKPSALDLLPSPAILLDADRAVLALNNAAEALLGDDHPAPEEFLARYTDRPIDFQGAHQGLFRLGGRGQLRSYLAMEAPVSTALKAEFPTSCYILFLSLMNWSDAFAEELATRLSLSAAELRVARGILEGRTAQEIAGDQGRSLATIRSHIKTLLGKTGTRRQTELVQFLTILRQVFDIAQTREGAATPPDLQGFASELLTGIHGQLEVFTFGAGKPMIYFATSSAPWENAAVRSAFAQAGFRVIAPARPGFGQSSTPAGDSSEALLDNWLDALIAQVGDEIVFAGHREGGILAARAAARFVANGGRPQGLLLVSTGAPVSDVTHLNDVPVNTRRSFLAARFAQPALHLGYLTAARYFRSGPSGERRIVTYFCNESAIDMALIKDQIFYDTVRDNLDFCLARPPQIVRDIAQWGSDWSESLRSVAECAPVLFVHGAQHHFLQLAPIKALCEAHSNVALLQIEDAAQLALYSHPEHVAQACKSTFL